MKRFLQITTAGFTACALFFALFSTLPINRSVLLQLFVMCASIGVVMSLYEWAARWRELPLLLDIGIRLLLCYLVVGLEGMAFGMFAMEWAALLPVSLVLVPAFIGAYTILYLTSLKYANDINQKIRERKKEKS